MTSAIAATEALMDQTSPPCVAVAKRWAHRRERWNTPADVFDRRMFGVQSTAAWKTYGRYDALYGLQPTIAAVNIDGRTVEIGSLSREHQLVWLNHLSAACMTIIAGLTGIRISEHLSLRADCLSTVKIDRDRCLLRIAGTTFKTSRRKEGDAVHWVAGWDAPDNPVREAVETLIRLHSRHGPVRADFPLLSPLKEKRKVSPISGDRHEFTTPTFAVKVNRFAAFNGITEWRFASHQFRKTFARFVTVVAPTAILALQRHFKHVSLQMTERYVPIDSDLVEEIIEESLVLQEERLLAIVTSDRLGGIKGEDILAKNGKYRGPEGRAAANDLVKMLMLDPSMRIVLHVYGACFYEETRAKCGGSLVKVGLETCQGCSNFAVDQSHLPFWRELVSTLDTTLTEIAGIGSMSVLLEQQRHDAQAMVERLIDGRP